MSGKFRRQRMPDRRTPFWLWPNLLSLDAPLVALAWLHMFARMWRVDFHPWQAYASLGLAVWGIYTLDRLLDVKMLQEHDPRLGERHRFHQRHSVPLGWLGMIAICGSAGIALFTMPAELFGHGFFGGGQVTFGYIFPILALLVVFFGLTITTAESSEVPLLRNLVAGMSFAYGTSMAAHVYIPTEGVLHLLLSREVLAFALLCSVNICAIHFWEHSRFTNDPEVKAADELSLTLPLGLLGSAAILFAWLDHEASTRPFFYAVLVSAALLFILNRRRAEYSLDALRVMADAAMLAPLLVFVAISGN